MIFRTNVIDNGVLVGLNWMLGSIAWPKPDIWIVTELDVSGGEIFGVSSPDFAELVQWIPNGLCLTNEQFREMGNSGVQILDGRFTGASVVDGIICPIYTLLCFDSSYWEVETNNRALISQLKASKFYLELSDAENH